MRDIIKRFLYEKARPLGLNMNFGQDRNCKIDVGCGKMLIVGVSVYIACAGHRQERSKDAEDEGLCQNRDWGIVYGSSYGSICHGGWA